MFFVYETENGFTYFVYEQQRDEFAKALVKEYLQDGWDDEVESIVAGTLTHTIQQTNIRYRKDQDFDEGGCDGEGKAWDSDWDYICNYELTSLDE